MFHRSGHWDNCSMDVQTGGGQYRVQVPTSMEHSIPDWWNSHLEVTTLREVFMGWKTGHRRYLQCDPIRSHCSRINRVLIALVLIIMNSRKLPLIFVTFAHDEGEC